MSISILPQIASLSQTGLSAAQPAAGAVTDGTQMFGDIYNQLVDGVNQTDSAFQADIVKAAAGEMDNPAQLLIDSSKAQVSLQLAGSVRNNALQAYNTIMNMQV